MVSGLVTSPFDLSNILSGEERLMEIAVNFDLLVMSDFIDSQHPFGASGLGIICGGCLDRIHKPFSSHPSDDGIFQAHGSRTIADLVFGYRSNQTETTAGSATVYSPNC